MSNPEVEITFFDTTLRDGAQALPEQNQFIDGVKPLIAHNIAMLGVGVIEAGFPATRGDTSEVEAVAETTGNTNYTVQEWLSGDYSADLAIQVPVIAGLSRCTPDDIETTWSTIERAVYPRIHTFISTDAEHMAAKFPDRSPDEVLKMGRYAVSLAKTLSFGNQNATVEFSAEAATTTAPQYLERVVRDMIGEGADVINVPDTVGQRDPFWMITFYGRVIEWVMSENPDVTISAHNHNDLGNASANSLSLLHAAAEFAAQSGEAVKIQIESTICGLGERAGNADIFSVAGSIFKFAPDLEVPIRWRFNPGLSVRTSHAVMQAAHLDVPRQSPIVGSDTNHHRSGIHSDGIIKGGHRIYTPHDPTFWGHQSDAVHEDGKYQGTRGRRAAQTT